MSRDLDRALKAQRRAHRAHIERTVADRKLDRLLTGLNDADFRAYVKEVAPFVAGEHD